MDDVDFKLGHLGHATHVYCIVVTESQVATITIQWTTN
jgi:hypothetical protein